MSLAELDLAAVQQLYDRALYVQAYEAARAGGLFDDPRPAARILTGRLLSNLGAPRRAWAITLRALRAWPQNPLVRYFGLRTVLLRRGPWEALQSWQVFGETHDGDPILASDWWSFRGVLAAMLRDFDAADRALAKAETLTPDNPWIYVERSEALSLEDRHEEALAAARRSLEIRPDYRPGLQCVAHLLESLNRTDEAIDLLTDALERIESGDVCFQLAGMLSDRERFAEARALLERIPALWPAAEKGMLEALAARKSHCAYRCGDEEAAIRFAREAKNKFYEQVADHLAAAAPDDRRAVLDVPFVRQHYATCAPATLSVLARYWNKPADHLEVAEKICYDGTPSQSERRWAEQNGFVAREFSVDLPTAKTLIDRGVPFTFTTVETTASHLQAVVGYDARCRTLLVRDSNYRSLGELMADKGLEHYRPTGPRGMTMVPVEETARLDGVELPDAPLYDRFYELLRGLDDFDRAAAAAALEHMRTDAPYHRLTLMGRRALAAFDNDAASGRNACEQLVRQFPECDVYLYALWFYLRRTAPRGERLEFLNGVLARRDADPIFRLHLAEELTDDARTHREADRVLRKLLRTRPFEARAYYLRANMLWSERRFDEATASYFVAACLADKDEDYARAYFLAARRVKRLDEALRFLRSRFERFGAKSGYPARTLFGCYATLDRMDEAFDVLREALALRPDDGTLLLFAADAEGRSGRFDRADDYWRRSEGRAHPGERLRTAAELASFRGDLKASLDHWRQLHELEPQNADVAAAVTRLLGELEGPEEARRYLLSVVERFPHNVALLQLAAEFLREDAPAEAERLVRRLIELNPIDPWSRRESAIDLSAQGRHDDALVELETAEALDPTNPSLHSIRGRVLESLARIPEAREAYRRALELSVDNELALDGLMRLAATHAERTAALAFVYDQIVGQTVEGDGLLAYGAYARRTLEPERVLAGLQAALDARPDLWHAWSAVVAQLIEMNRLDEALETARRETERFSLVPGSWVDLARVARVRNDDEAEIAALQKALEINPVWAVPLRNLCEAFERAGRYDEARSFLEQALRRRPTDPILRGQLADLHWRADRRDDALAALEQAVRLEPGYDWGWDRLRDYGRAAGQPQRAADAARELARRLPDQARSWMVTARVLEGADTLDERLAAVERAVRLNPMLPEAYVLRSRLHCEGGKFDEAEADCRPAVFGDAPPPQLGVQQAEVLAARGDREAALARLETVVAEHPDHWAGWSLLAEWCEGDPQRRDTHRRAAEALVRLSPQNPWAWRNLAEAHRAAEENVAAAEAYERALELDPDYEYCANWLFDLAADDDRWSAAERWVNHALARNPSAYALARHVRLCVRYGRDPEAIASFERLCRLEAPNDWPIMAAAKELQSRRTSKRLQTSLLKLLADPQARPAVFAAWVEACAKRWRWKECEQALDRHADRPEHWVAGVAALLSQYGDRRLGDRARKFLDAHAERLRADDFTWGQAAYALCSNDRFGEVIDWMRDWRDRSGTRPWMLLNLGMALVMTDRLDEAAAVHRAAIDDLPADHATAAHHVYRAACAAACGRWDEVGPALADLAPESLQGDERILYDVVRAFDDLRPRGVRKPSWWSAYHQDAAAVARFRHHRQRLQSAALLRKLTRRIHRRFAEAQGRTWYAAWLAFRS